MNAQAKPTITLDHVSIAPAQSGVSVCVTLTVLLDDPRRSTW